MTSARRRRYDIAMRRLDHGSPVGSLDLAAFHADGTPYVIWPCVDCAAWHAEVITEDDGYVFVREWHSIECAPFPAVFERLRDYPAGALRPQELAATIADGKRRELKHGSPFRQDMLSIWRRKGPTSMSEGDRYRSAE